MVLELTRREAGKVAVCWKFMSFQENLGKRNCEIEGETERRKGESSGKRRKERDSEKERGKGRKREEARGLRGFLYVGKCREKTLDAVRNVALSVSPKVHCVRNSVVHIYDRSRTDQSERKDTCLRL